MKYRYENFTFPPDQSFTIRSEEFEIKKYTEFRCHVNFEIALLQNCSGRRFIGDHIEDFNGPDLILMGSYLPHCWQFYKREDSYGKPNAIVLHFFPDFLGKDFLSKPEARSLRILFDQSTKGIHFTGITLMQAISLMQQMLLTSGLRRTSLMIQLLDLLSNSNEKRLLATSGFNTIGHSKEADKMNRIHQYIFKNFQKEITLNKVAELIHMTPASFCRFFKSKTNRTLISFIKEVRIGYASRLLVEGNSNITEACYNSGHNNLSSFNKHFKEVKGMSPREFLKQYKPV